jgi:hypothetical protein
MTKTTLSDNKTADSLPKKNEFVEKISLLIIGFILTGIIGTFVSFYFQTKTSINNYNMGLIESERKAARDIFEEVIKDMDSRVYYAQLVSDDYSFHPETGVQPKVWDKYVIQMNAWNENINRRKSLGEMYFGPQCLNTIEMIHSNFLDLNILLNEIKKGNPASQAKAKTLAYSINARIYKLSNQMTYKILNDSVGRIPVWKKNAFEVFSLKY